MMKTTLVAFAAILALGACGRKAAVGGGTVSFRGANGQTVTVGHQLPPNMPAYAPVYAGATVTSAMNSGVADAAHGIVVYEVAAPPATLVDFYKKAAAAGGLAMSFDSGAVKPGDTSPRVLMFDQKGTKRNLSLTVTALPGGKQKVGLIFGPA